MPVTLDHIVLNVVNMEPMLRFYTEVLALPGERVQAYADEKAPFPSVRINADTIIDLFPKDLWAKTENRPLQRPNLNHFCLSLEKAAFQELQRRLSQNNISLEKGPVKRWGAHGTGISIYFRDPEDNLIEARYYDADETAELDRPVT